MHCRHIPAAIRNDKPLPRQQSLAVLTPVITFPSQPVVSWHDWNCAVPVTRQEVCSGHVLSPNCTQVFTLVSRTHEIKSVGHSLHLYIFGVWYDCPECPQTHNHTKLLIGKLTTGKLTENCKILVIK